MSEEILANVPEGTVQDMAQLESNQPVGESTQVEPEVQVGESNESPTELNGEPGEGLFDGMTPEKLHESYKSLQTELGKRTESSKSLEDRLTQYGGIDQIAIGDLLAVVVMGHGQQFRIQSEDLARLAENLLDVLAYPLLVRVTVVIQKDFLQPPDLVTA